MREYMENEMNNGPEKIDIDDFLMDLIRGIKKLWWLILGLAFLFGLASYLKTSTSYCPTYVASATMAVNVHGNRYNYVNIDSAQQMAEVFPYILTSGVLQDVVAEDLGLDYIPGNITAKAEEGINLFTLSVSSADARQSYDILQSVIENYPKVARFVLGETTLKIMDETGIPEDTGKKQVIRGSLKRGIFKGGILGLLIMLIYVLTRRTVKSRKELRRKINLEDYGSVPYVYQKKRRRKEYRFHVNLLNERIPQVYLEAVRKLRIKVVKELEEKNFKTLMVTSSVPGEGKTTLAVNLAIAIAKQGKRVILVDADPRNPSVAEQLNLMTKKEKGLGAVLRGEVAVEQALMEVKVSRGELRVIYGTEPCSEDAKLLGTAAMKNLINALKTDADVVILDTAPSELLADAPTLAKYVDAALYVVKYDYAKLRHIRMGVRSLAMSGIDIIGYVFNADRSGVQRGYSYGYRKANYSYFYQNSKYFSHFGSSSKRKEEENGRIRKE